MRSSKASRRDSRPEIERSESKSDPGCSGPSSKSVCPKQGAASGITGFMKVLEEMDEMGESERDVSGKVEGPFFSRAIFGCKIRLGLERRRRRR